MFKKIAITILLWMSYTYVQAIIPAHVQNSDNLTTNSVITLEVDVSNTNDDSPNLAVLANSFEIYGVSNSSQTSIINGNITHNKKLIISLGAKKSGTLVIPPIKIGNDQTNSLTINVKEGTNQVARQNNTPSTNNNASIILDANSTSQKVYVNNPFIYKIKLYFNVPISNVNLENINIANAQIEPYDKTKQYQERYQNQEYMVVEQKFIITPTISGQLHIPPAKIKGNVNDNNNPTGNPFIGRSTPFIRTSKALDITVLAKPNNISAKDFFPARQINVDEKWSIADNSVIDIGTPINHTITIKAYGTSLTNFPQINESKLAGFSYYEDKATSTQEVINDEIVTSKTYKFTLIPKESGEYTLQPQAIKWLNTQTESLETIKLQSHSFKVNRDKNIIIENKADESAITTSNTNPINTKLILIIISIIILVIIVGYSIFKLIKKQQHNSKYWTEIQHALKTNNLELLIQSIILYVERQTKVPMLTLEDVAKYYQSSTLLTFAKKINQAKYKNETFNELNGLVNEIDKLTRQKAKPNKAELKDFYPK